MPESGLELLNDPDDTVASQPRQRENVFVREQSDSGVEAEGPCWCRSGRPYASCHRDEDADGPVHPRAYQTEILRTVNRQRTCWHPEAPSGCHGGPIRAHTIQRSATLARIADHEHRVRSFFPLQWDAFGELRAHPVGWKDASTFHGFCAKHDAAFFRPIDVGTFEREPRQCALIAYRSLCHELHKKKVAQVAVRENGIALLKGRTPAERRVVDDALSATYWGREKGIEELTEMKAEYDAALASCDFAGLRSAAFMFEGDLSVASSGVVAPDFDCSGTRLQIVADDGMQSLAFSTTLTKEGAAIVFSWPKRYERMERFISSLAGLEGDALASALVLFMFSYVENTFFSQTWWEGLAPAKRKRVSDAAGTVRQYGNPVNYRAGRLVPWHRVRLKT